VNGQQHFHQVIALHESTDLEWETLADKAPFLPRGWYELSQLSGKDRIEFSHDYWQSRLFSPESAGLKSRLSEFFEDLEEIGIYVTQSRRGAAFDAHMVYSLKEARGFFQGGPPASEEMLSTLKKQFSHFSLPSNYLAFLQIHNGFNKYTDIGLIPTRDMVQVYQKLQHLLAEAILIAPDGKVIDPQNLIPFYESIDLHCYQCFYTEWSPEGEIGNLYFSESQRSISNFHSELHQKENLAFPSFFEWLMFYLENNYREVDNL
jgi:hypothetical protein